MWTKTIRRNEHHKEWRYHIRSQQYKGNTEIHYHRLRYHNGIHKWSIYRTIERPTTIGQPIDW